MSWLYDLAVVVHVLSATIWVGGVVFMGAVAVPMARKMSTVDRQEVTKRLGFAFRPVGWIALALLVLTGIYMSHAWGASFQNVLNLEFFTAPHLRLLGFKILAVSIMMLVSGIHDWFIGPRSALVPDSHKAEQMRRIASWLGRITGLLVIIIVVLAVFVARPHLL